MPASGWVGKPNALHTRSGASLRLREEGHSDAGSNMDAPTWMKLEDVMLSETSQLQKDKCCFIPRVVKFIETKRRMVVAKGWGVGRCC